MKPTMEEIDAVREVANLHHAGVCDLTLHPKIQAEHRKQRDLAHKRVARMLQQYHYEKPTLKHGGKLVRIIDTDNFGGDYPDEKFHLFPMSEQQAQVIVDVLNEDWNEHSSRYYKVVPLDYKLQPGFEP